MGSLFLPFMMLAGAGIGVAEDVARSNAEAEAEQQQEEAIHLQESRSKTQAAAQQIQRDKAQDAVLSQQKAMAAARGMSEASGSFQSSVLGGMQSYEHSSKLGNISLSMSLDNMEAEIDQARKKESAEQMGNMFDIGKTVFGAAADIGEMEESKSGGSGSYGVPENLKQPQDWLRSQSDYGYGYSNRAWGREQRNLDDGMGY